MPQMMPINWIFYFILFLTIFFLFNIMNYYIFIFKINNKNKKNYIMKKINWKW